MPIKFSFKKLPVDGDGVAYDSLESFQSAEIKKLVPVLNIDMARQLVDQKDAVMEILELTMDARPAARGIKKPRKAKATIGTLPLEQSVA